MWNESIRSISFFAKLWIFHTGGGRENSNKKTQTVCAFSIFNQKNENKDIQSGTFERSKNLKKRWKPLDSHKDGRQWWVFGRGAWCKAWARWCGRLTNRSVFRFCIFDGGGGFGLEEDCDVDPATVEVAVVVAEFEFRTTVVAFLWLSYFKPIFTRCFIVVMHASRLWWNDIPR